jgi:SIR2-like domain
VSALDDTPPVAPPGPGLDPTLALALGVTASPGVYAMLLGSGISTAAGVLTGWGVVTDLIRKVAVLQGEQDARDADADPEGWWAGQGRGEPRYDTLLEAVASSVAARRDLLHGYFEPASQEECDRGMKLPTAAHRAIAELVRDGRIRLILTTNFDHLMEDALTAAGVPPQVIARPDAIAGMAPLQHARATVIKLHGDYLDVEAMLNTPAELGAYHPAMQALLARVLDEHGLIVVGWSGEWDTALIRAIQDCPSRRYPTYWAAHRGHISTAAGTLLAGRAGHLIPIDGADSFCTGLRDKVSVLAAMADPPPTRAVAIATLKRNFSLGRRIDAFDQFNAATTATCARLTTDRYPAWFGNTTNDKLAAEIIRQIADYDLDTDVLMALAATAAFHGSPGTDDLVLRAARRIAEPPRLPQTIHPPLAGLRGYPALRLVTAIGVAAVAAHREELLYPLLVQTTSATLALNGTPPLISCVHPWRVITDDAVKLTAQWLPTSQHVLPATVHLRNSCRLALAEFTDDREYTAAFDRYEFLRAMLEVHHTEQRAAVDGLARRQGLRIPDVEEVDDQWPLLAVGGFGGDADQARQAHAAVLRQIQQTLFL